MSGLSCWNNPIFFLESGWRATARGPGGHATLFAGIVACQIRKIPLPGGASAGSGPDTRGVKEKRFHGRWVNDVNGYPVPFRYPARLITPDEKHSPTRA